MKKTETWIGRPRLRGRYVSTVDFGSGIGLKAGFWWCRSGSGSPNSVQFGYRRGGIRLTGDDGEPKLAPISPDAVIWERSDLRVLASLLWMQKHEYDSNNLAGLPALLDLLTPAHIEADDDQNEKDDD